MAIIKRKLKSAIRRVMLYTCFILMKLGLRVLPYKRLSNLLVRAAPNQLQEPSTASLRRARRDGRYVNRMAQAAPFHVTCLERSLTLWYILRWRRIRSSVRFGVRIQPHGIDAHAWVTHNETVINDRPDVGAQFGVYPDVLAPDHIVQWVG